MGSGQKFQGVLQIISSGKLQVRSFAKRFFLCTLLTVTVLLTGCDWLKQQTTQGQQRGAGDNEASTGSASYQNIALHPGKVLHDANCISCHDNGKYQSAERQVSDFPALLTQVRRCNANLHPSLSDDDIKQVADYLQQAFYSTTGVNNSEL